RHVGPARGLRAPDRGPSAELHRPAHAVALARARGGGRSLRRPSRRPAPVYPLRQGDLRVARRAHASGAAEGIARGQFVSRRGQQGHRVAVRLTAAPTPRHPMLSHVADSLYWMSRYIERAENVARFIDVNLQLSLDLPRGASEQWAPLVNTTGDNAP